MSIFYRQAKQALKDLPQQNKFEENFEFRGDTPRPTVKSGAALGKRFGSLVAIRAPFPSSPYVIEFKCDCGRVQNLPFHLVKKAGDKAKCGFCLGAKIKSRNPIPFDLRNKKIHYWNLDSQGKPSVICNKNKKLFGTNNANYPVREDKIYNCKQCHKVALKMAELGHNWQSVVDKFNPELQYAGEEKLGIQI